MSKYIDYLSALQYNLSSGLDFTISDTVFNRYDVSDVSSELSGNNLYSSSSSLSYARELATSCSSLSSLKEVLANFDGCELKSTAKNLVFGDGNSKSRIVFIGEAPGRDEDLQGKPFVGRSGRLLDSILACIGLDRDNCYITNIVPWRPPGNRAPSQEERAICFPFLSRHIFLLNPLLVVLLGGVASKEILGVEDGIMKLRGREYELSQSRFGLNVPVIPTFHPAYLLRQPSFKRLCWQDFLYIKHRWSQLKDS